MNPDTAVKIQTRPQSVKQRLKAERVQEMLQAMPAWRLLPGGKAIDRAFQFPASHVAAAWTTFVAAFAAELGHTVTLDIAQEQVVLTLAGLKVKGRREELTESIVEFAQRLG
jgi:pterin-4a-carbinolamine dehydratase